MALDADVIGLQRIEARRIHDAGSAGRPDVIAAWSMALFAADVPFRHRLGLDVVVNRMAAIAKRSSRPLHVVGGIEFRPPVGTVGGEVGTPHLVREVPLSREWI